MIRLPENYWNAPFWPAARIIAIAAIIGVAVFAGFFWVLGWAT